MAEYYVVRDKNTGLYFRGKGVNRWGKYYNQASIYRIRANAENTIKEVSWRGEQAEVVPIQIVETTAEVEEVRHGRWQIEDRGGKPTDKPICSQCGATPKYYVNGESSPYCQECGSKMERKVKPYVRQRKKT